MSQLDVTADNSTTGAGVIDTWHSLATAIGDLKDAHGADKAAVCVEIGVDVVSGVLDTVAMVLDPLAKLISAGLGWLIEHVGFLRWPLDQVAGDPDEIKKIAEQLHKIGEDLRNTADDLEATLKKQVTGWQGPAADRFTSAMDGHRTHLDDAGHSVDVAGYVVETTMAVIAAVRALFRDIITTVLGDIISVMLIALATAPVTFGASIVAGVTTCVTLATVQVTSMTAKLAKVGALASRSAGRLKELSGMTKAARPGGSSAASAESHALDDLPPASGSHTPDEHAPDPHGEHGDGTPGGTAPSSEHGDDYDDVDDILNDYHHGDDYDDVEDILNDYHHGDTSPSSEHGSEHGDDGPPGDHASQHEDGPGDTSPAGDHESGSGSPDGDHAPPPAPPKPVSVLDGQNIPGLKAHEDWLRKVYEGPAGKAKFVDNWIRNKFPDAYPWVKGMADAKSSKNWVGWVDKNAVQVDKQLTDIHTQAEQAWEESDQEWHEQHQSG